MKENHALTVASLLSIVLITLHLADDITRGFDKGGLATLNIVPILVVWLYGTLVAGERRSGLVIILILSILGTGLPVLHLSGKGVGAGSRLANTSGAIFFIWTLIAVGVSTAFSVVLSVRGLWRLRKGQAG